MTSPRYGRIALLYDCTYPHVPGGGQKRLFEIFRRLVAMGWEVDWYGLKAWEGEEIPEIEGIRFIPVAPAKPLYGEDGKRSITQTLYYGKAIARFPAIGGYDIVHMGQWPYFHFFPARLFSLFGGARVTADWWEVWAGHWRKYYGAKGYLGMALERLCARVPKRLVAISETGVQQLRGLGVPARKLEVIHNGIDFHAIASTPPADMRSDLIYLGRLQPHKNVHLLIEALALLAQQGHEFSLSIIGEGPERKSLQALADKLDVSSQITWLGAVQADTEVYGHLRASRIFVHPSTKEGGGSITSLEANAAGLPVVAFTVPEGISSELIVEGRNGCWVQGVEASRLADGINRAHELTQKSDTRENCAAFARDFDWSGLSEQYHKLFVRMTAGKANSPS
jgi:L-malate glycosyltransferase